MSSRYIPKQDIAPWLETVARERVVFAPVREGRAVTFRPFAPGSEVELDAVPDISPKEMVFPQTETLFAYERTAPTEEGGAGFEITETLPAEKTVVFGARPCGAGGLGVFDRVYQGHGARDPYYAARRENTVFVTMACVKPAPTCFCTSVGSGPGDPEGSDVMLYPWEDGYVAEALTEAGEAVLALGNFAEAGDSEVEAKALVAKAEDDMGEPMDFSGVPEKFMQAFKDTAFWEKLSAACLSCGICTYLCPTCHCFNITDEGSEARGKRVRTWDNCMSFAFTLEGSGHNPRATKALRLRNRVGHKFAYFPQLHEGLPACRGCGRCIAACPAGVDIRALAKAVQEYEK